MYGGKSKNCGGLVLGDHGRLLPQSADFCVRFQNNTRHLVICQIKHYLLATGTHINLLASSVWSYAPHSSLAKKKKKNLQQKKPSKTQPPVDHLMRATCIKG